MDLRILKEIYYKRQIQIEWSIIRTKSLLYVGGTGERDKGGQNVLVISISFLVSCLGFVENDCENVLLGKGGLG